MCGRSEGPDLGSAGPREGRHRLHHQTPGHRPMRVISRTSGLGRACGLAGGLLAAAGVGWALSVPAPLPPRFTRPPLWLSWAKCVTWNRPERGVVLKCVGRNGILLILFCSNALGWGEGAAIRVTCDLERINQ